MEPNQLVGPVVLFFLMIVVGLDLRIDDFRRVLAAPRAVIGGTLGQLVLLPLMTWAVVEGLGVSPVFGAGAILVAVSPGAGMSNIMTALAGANTALSVTLTGVTSVIAVVTLPGLSALAMEVFLGNALAVEVPVALLFTQLTLSLLLPITLGMWTRARRPDLADRFAARLRRVALGVVVLAVVLGSVSSERPDIALNDAITALVAAVVWTAAAMGIGWGLAALLRLEPADRFTFLIEFSARNVAVAIIVALSGLSRLDLSFFSGFYVAVGYPMVGLAIVARRRRWMAPPSAAG